MIQLIIADDHPIVREGLKRIITEYSDMHLVSEVADGNEVLAQCREHDVDVLLLDISMPGPGFLNTLQRIGAEYPDVRVLVLSTHPEDQYAVRALKAGAAGYLTKNHTPEELADAIRHVYNGRKYVSPIVAEELVSQLNSGKELQLYKNLSNREYQILCMMGSGKQLNKIASSLSLSPKTISTYRNRILDKLKLKTTGELIRYAVENGLED
ncbi:MAG: response regulator transcription factor [Proteobacteria bacterium]|nr:response regulator transcription factor [Pseudomonadota bacterium]